MQELVPIVAAHVVHVMAGVAWAGSVFALAAVIVPLATRHGAQADPGLGMAARRAGRSAAIAALLTVISGIYLFAVLHPHDDSAGGIVLKSGALAALLAIAVGVLVARPAGRRFAQLQQRGDATPPDDPHGHAVLRRRVMLASRAVAGLLGISVLAMSAFRYAAALA